MPPTICANWLTLSFLNASKISFPRNRTITPTKLRGISPDRMFANETRIMRRKTIPDAPKSVVEKRKVLIRPVAIAVMMAITRMVGD